MRKVFTCLFMCLMMHTLYGQIDKKGNAINVVSYFSVNDTLEYQFSNVKMKVSGKDTTYDLLSEETFRLVVLEELKKGGYRIEYTPLTVKCVNDSNLSAKGKLYKALIEATANNVSDYQCVIVTDELGKITHMENYKSYIKKINNLKTSMVDAIYKEMPAMEQIMSRKKFEKIMKSTVPSTEEQALTMIEEVSLLFENTGLQFKMGTLDTIIDGSKYVLEVGAEKEKNEYSIGGDYFLNSKLIKQIPLKGVASSVIDEMTDLFSDEMRKNLGDNAEEVKQKLDDKTMDFQIKTSHNYWYNGWMKDAMRVKSTKVEDLIEEYEIMNVTWTSRRF